MQTVVSVAHVKSGLFLEAEHSQRLAEPRHAYGKRVRKGFRVSTRNPEPWRPSHRCYPLLPKMPPRTLTIEDRNPIIDAATVPVDTSFGPISTLRPVGLRLSARSGLRPRLSARSLRSLISTAPAAPCQPIGLRPDPSAHDVPVRVEGGLPSLPPHSQTTS